MQALTQVTGLSAYCLSVLHDFTPSHFATATASNKQQQQQPKRKQQLQDVICHNRHIVCMHPKDSQTRRLTVIKREEELERAVRRGQMSARDKDYALVHEMVATGHTSQGHFVYCYYVGPERRSSLDLGQPKHWAIVDKAHLALFHRRLERDVAQCYVYTSVQVTETQDGRGNLELDMRYVLQKWVASKQGKRALPQLAGHADLFAAGHDYLANQHCPTGTSTAIVPAKQKKSKKKLVVVVEPSSSGACTDMVVCEPGDPYEVCDDEYRHINDADYDRLCGMPVPADVRFGFRHWMDVSRRSALRPALPPDYYDHDPIHLFDALVMSLNGELHSQGTMEQVMRQRLLVIENDGVAPLMEAMSLDPQVSQDIQAYAEEYAWTLMAVQNASNVLPATLAPLFDATPETGDK